MNREAKEMMKQYLEDMKNVTPEQDDYLARHHIALEYSRMLEEEEDKEKKGKEYVSHEEFMAEFKKRELEAKAELEARGYEYNKSNKSSTRNILLGIGAVVAGVLGCYAISKSSSDDGYTSIEDNSYDYTDYNCNNYYYDDYGSDWY